MLKIIKCETTWCNPCRQLGKIMKEVLPTVKNAIEYQEVDVEENADFAEENKIRSVPTTIFMKNNVEVYRFSGTKSGSEIKSLIEEYNEEI